MKKKEWNEGLDHLAPDLVEKYIAEKERLSRKKKIKSIWVRCGAVAACFALIVFAAAVVLTLREDDTVDPPIDIPGIDTTLPSVSTAPSDTTEPFTDTTDLDTKTPDDTTVSVNNETTGTEPIQSPDTFASFEAFEKQEREAGDKGVSHYYIPTLLPDGYELSEITKRDGVYVMVEYTLKDGGYIPGEDLTEYDAERLNTLICRYSLYSDGEKALEMNFKDKGYEPTEYGGRVYYRWDEPGESGYGEDVIGYEIAFLEDGDFIFMHLPAIDTFENMMRFTGVTKIDITRR